ncbi:MAG: OsmC family protein [Phycisphaerales bacterium]|nr:OsmC family protein [Phycisphaerales bacterium]
MVQVDVTYTGDLQCRCVHGPSGQVLLTDAPVDNNGKGENFSPTDLIGTALSTCMFTIMGIVAKREGIDLAGATCQVRKEMSTQLPRRIAKLTLEFNLPAKLGLAQRLKLENAARTCPVGRAVTGNIELAVSFVWQD